ncbi:LOB domain-containing protein 1-like isoform X1 [Jatropha curcas]|uniref:LOB domain-containing protein 1-like isoform X1 n=1 Tax=Jatropha curcas TaxID=180498 RepID=UPI0018952439|nr:LOB domain-containing protein 1-like isoform X1 [Jatropha curcas]
MGNNPFLFAPTDSYSQPSLPSSSSSQSPLQSPSPSSNSCSSRPSSDSSPSLNSPLQPSQQSLPQLPSHTSSSHFDPPSAAVVGPCAACEILRRRCTDKCYLASYFPPTTEPDKLNIIDSVFGVSNTVKILQNLPKCQRVDAVSSMIYEANARIRDPVYGCVGHISLLQKQVSELQAQLAKAQVEVVNVQCQQANFDRSYFYSIFNIVFNKILSFFNYFN